MRRWQTFAEPGVGLLGEDKSENPRNVPQFSENVPQFSLALSYIAAIRKE